MTVAMQEQSEDVESASADDLKNGTISTTAKDENGSSSDSSPVGGGGGGGTPRRAFERKLSISEQASAGSSGRCRAPPFLRWIEYPFRIKNTRTGAYLEEVTGHAMDVAARGPINQTGSFVGNATLLIAAKQAGGMRQKVYGIQVSSLLTVGSLVVGLVAGITMPFVGAIVDHTDHRKAMGTISALVTVLAVGFQLLLSPDTWFIVFILEIIGGYFLIMHQVCTMAYLPDLSHNITEMGHYTSRLMMNQYFFQGIFTSIVIAYSFSGSRTNLGTAKVAAGLSCGLGCILFGYSWIFLFRKRPRLQEIPPGDSLVTTGFKRLLKTSRVVFAKYKTLKWLMIALLFSPEAGAGVMLNIAVTFLTIYVRMTVREIAIVSLVMLFMNIPGAFVSMKMCRWINPLNSFRCAELMFALVNGLIAGTVTGSTDRDKNLVYFYAGLVGLSFGWMFPSQRTLAVAIIPKGQETEIMGLISFFGQVVGWLPAFVFTAMNENGVSMRWGLGSVSFFLVTSFLCTLGCGSFDDAVKLVEHTSDEYLDAYARKSSGGVAGEAYARKSSGGVAGEMGGVLMVTDGGKGVAAADGGERDTENGNSP